MEKYYAITHTARLLGVSTTTINRWEKDGKIVAVWTPGKHRRFSESEINRLLGKARMIKNRAVIYARVSSTKQRENGNLDRQKERLLEYAKDKNYAVVDIFTETASGLNENRKRLHQLLDLIENEKLDIVLVEFRDRLTRFGFRYLERYANTFGVAIEVVEKRKVKQPQEELADDLIAIITSFASRLYGLRSQKFKKVKKILKENAANP
ncbi:MAG: IS607 family transposase [Candidatus Altiarchaeota archaeon]|nr:IS607 family transposase [Candidatus Altiarchaeota archaeon]